MLNARQSPEFRVTGPQSWLKSQFLAIWNFAISSTFNMVELHKCYPGPGRAVSAGPITKGGEFSAYEQMNATCSMLLAVAMRHLKNKKTKKSCESFVKSPVILFSRVRQKKRMSSTAPQCHWRHQKQRHLWVSRLHRLYRIRYSLYGDRTVRGLAAVPIGGQRWGSPTGQCPVVTRKKQ